jgi:pyruvate kinase
MTTRNLLSPLTVGSVAALTTRLEQVRASMLELESGVDLKQFGAQRDSARNLLHYLAFRRFDLRREQACLANWGLSSLGRSESHVLHNLDAVLSWLYLQRGRRPKKRHNPSGPSPERGQQILEKHSQALLGPPRAGRGVRIMVTMPTEAATDYSLVRDLLDGGMDCARINCAHDGPDEWARMVANIRHAGRVTGRKCKVLMDLSGPKIRTGAIEPGPSVMKLRPERDEFGRTAIPATVWLAPIEESGRDAPEKMTLKVPQSWLDRRRLKERIRFTDARGSKREMRIVDRVGGRYRAEVHRTAYFTTGTTLLAFRSKGRADPTSIGPVPPIEQRIRLSVGDMLVVTAIPELGQPARRDSGGRVMKPAHISCTLPEALEFVRQGEPIWFDDGKIEGIVRSATAKGLVVEITRARAGGGWLAADKGINLPQTLLNLSPASAKDLEDLRAVVKLADVVGFSFVHKASDLKLLRSELANLGRPRMGVFLKVETRWGFEELPGLLLEALREPPVGVMIARGDLAVEVGFERLAEVQEEILWLCEAAHIPAVWATQVLEGVAKSGIPSRAEVTDAAMGARAECVMLNKGPHVGEAVRALDSILRRMQTHQAKKTAMLRQLNLAEHFT